MPKAMNAESQIGAPLSTAALTDEELSAMVWHEVSGTGRVIARARIVALLVVSVVMLALLLLDASRWRHWVFASVTGLVAVVLVRDFFWFKNRALTPRLIPYVLAPVVILHTVIIFITGGADSPFLVLYLVVGMVPAMTIGRLKPFLAMASVPMALLWLFSVGAVTGLLPNLTPDLFGPQRGFGTNAPYTYTQAVVFTAATLIGGAVILTVRAAVERTARSAAVMRHELVSTMHERNRELLSLSSELAHELKNPLASIQGLSTLVERKLAPDSKEREQMQVLIGEVKRMGATLDEFLNFSRPVAGLSARQVQPAAVMAEVIGVHEGIAHQRDVTLSFDGGAVEPILCDRRKVKQVLVNLVQNALEATPRGGAISVTIEPGPTEGVRFVIADTGPGIADEIRSRLFKPGATTKTDGSGLGLTIARAIAEQHGGTLTLDRREAGGCRAELTLPARPAEPPLNEQGVSESHEPASAGSSAAAAASPALDEEPS